ncbi:MAG: hypothetical protein ACREFC_12145 [Stellaceae bacterium]
MTARALFRFTGPEESQLACIDKGESWTVQGEGDFVAANGGGATGAWLWDTLPYVPRPMDDCPELEAALQKVREYLREERPVRDKIACYRSQGILADEAELLGKIADIDARLVSMYLAKAAKLFSARLYAQDSEPAVLALVESTALNVIDSGNLKSNCADMVAEVLSRSLPEELTGRLSAAEAQNLARDVIDQVLAPKGRLRERARRDPQKLGEIVGLATLPMIARGQRHNVAPMLIEMLEYANLIGFDAELGDADNWPRLRARAKRGVNVA